MQVHVLHTRMQTIFYQRFGKINAFSMVCINQHRSFSTLTRLSTIAGERLRLHNPGIADLSDENRPNKLAEKFSELYDNQWTEALESLNRTGQSERVSVENLLKTLEVYFQHYKAQIQAT